MEKKITFNNCIQRSDHTIVAVCFSILFEPFDESGTGCERLQQRVEEAGPAQVLQTGDLSAPLAHLRSPAGTPQHEGSNHHSGRQPRSHQNPVSTIHRPFMNESNTILHILSVLCFRNTIEISYATHTQLMRFFEKSMKKENLRLTSAF